MKGSYKLNILRSGFVNGFPLIIIGIDENGNIFHWNKQAEDVMGFSRREAKSLGIQAILPLFVSKDQLNADVPSALRYLKCVLTGKSSIEGKETTMLSRDGRVQYVKWSAHRADGRGSKGERGLILSGVDQTDLFILRDVMTEKSKYARNAATRLKRYAKIDPMTGLFNYRHLISELNKSFYSSMESGTAVSLAIMNVDYFYSINSAYGNSRGNRIFRELATFVKNGVNKDFVVSRFSGGELAILMPETDIKSAFSFSRRIFSKVSEHVFGGNGGVPRVNLTVRMVLGGYPHCEDAKTPEQLIGRVFDKLAEARATASNTVLICAPNSSFAEDLMSDTLTKGEYPYTVEFVNALARAVKSKDHYTQQHSSIMSEYAVLIAEYLGLNKNAKSDVRLGSILHDVGKIGIDKNILLKPDVLSEEEREIIKQHPRIGAEIIRNVHPLKGVVPIVLHHHERYDGNGYLEGLKGEEIPMGARIVSLADVFQALTSDRPYRAALSQKEALSIIEEYSGTFFDPNIVKAFFEVYASHK